MKANTSIVLNVDTTSVQKKLTAIVNHAESLAKELEEIDQANESVALAGYSTEELIEELSKREEVHHVNSCDIAFEVKVDLLEAKKYTVITNNCNPHKIEYLNKMKEAAEDAAKNF